MDAITLFISSIEELDALILKNFLSALAAIISATVVLPTPGGPKNIIFGK